MILLALLALCAAALAAAPPAAAQSPVPPPDHLRYRLSAGLQYSDNRFRRADGPADLLLVSELGFSFLRAGERWRAEGAGELGTEVSLDHGGDDRVRVRLDGQVDWMLLPQQLYWRIEDHADVEAIDPLAPDSPDNRQQINLFQTGPFWLLDLPGAWQSRLHAEYARGDAEHSPDFDHHRLGAGGWLSRRDAVRAWELGFESAAVDFDQGNDYHRHDALLRFDNQVPRSGVRLEAGRTWIDFERQASRAHPLLRADLRWTPRQDSEWRALFTRELSDAGRDLIGVLESDPAWLRTTRRGTIGADPYRLRNAELQWRRHAVRSAVTVALFDRDYRYLDRVLGLDRDSRGLRGSLRLALSPLSVLEAEAGVERFAFGDVARRDRDRFAALRLERRLAPRWALRGGLAHFRRRSNVADASYSENVLSLFLVYAVQR